MMSWLIRLADKIPPILSGLASEARKYPDAEQFQKAFLRQIKHGMYWHVTGDPNFFIDPAKGPHDMSSMGGGGMSPGNLMITSDLEHWASNYAPHRMFAALIDMSSVSADQYKQVERGFGNEFFVDDSSQAKVVGVFPIKEALRIDYEHHNSLPQNFEELKRFWEIAQVADVPLLGSDELLSHFEHLDPNAWNQQWKEEWEEEWAG